MKRNIATTTLIVVVWMMILLVGLPALAQAPEAPADFTYNPQVDGMIAQVVSTTVYNYDAQLSGEVAAIIGGTPYTITTRNTASGVPIQQATQFVYEHLQQQGLTASYHNWTNCGRSNRNVVGVLTGTLTPNEIVLITAHLDDMPSSGRAPGADDNASGSVGVMLVAEIMSQYHFERTVRFVFFTGEEQGLCGSEVYADAVSAAGDNIVAVYNMDMIAYDSVGGPTLRLHTRTTSNPGYAGDLAIAGVFTNVVNTYSMGSVLTPIIDPDGITASDHSPFWSVGYPAILAIEDDDDDFNAYYHTINDNLSHINLTYFTNFVKASVGTAAHLAKPVTSVGYLRGIVLDANTLQPIGAAPILATAGMTRTGSTTADSSGQYTLTLLEGVYTATATAYGYAPVTIGGIAITTDLTTTQDFALSPVNSYTVTGQVYDTLTGKPLSATITIGGYPSNPISTAEDGTYQVALAAEVVYQFHVQANVPGYFALDRSVGPLSATRVEDFALNADLAACLAPGYTLLGLSEQFNTTALPAGWNVINNVGTVGWTFDNPGGRSNLTGGTSNFAIADSDDAGPGISMNTELRTPVIDLSTQSHVTLTFKTDFRYYSSGQSEVADVDVSVNGASGPWTNVWRKTADYRGPKIEVVNLTSLAANQANVMLRFHYYNAVYEYWWEVDDVQIGQCVVNTTVNVPIFNPTAAAQSGDPGTTITYTLQLSNTDSVTHTFDLLPGAPAWPINVLTSLGPVSAQSAMPLTLTVSIPANTLANATDVIMLTARAQDNALMQTTAALTTTANLVRGVQLGPASAAQNGVISQMIDYTLYLTNTGNLTDTFTLSASHHTWHTQIMPISLTLPHASGAVVKVFVTVPITAMLDISDMVQITAQGTGVSASSWLTTTITAHRIWLPLTQKD
ncbi:Bacterial leucyl aminopeptidase [Thermoflexales bacterium]|nr:Bacterial leucyl aminopeptidase [Thermoflexales bacterium]